jgi:hypothetical protein
MEIIITEQQYRSLNEIINLDIKVGDTLLGGKFKNKKVVVKKIGKNDKGDITINGKPLLRFRMISENVTDKQFKKILPKLLAYSYVGKVSTISQPHIAFFNKNDDVVMVYSINTQTMFIKTNYITILRHILGLNEIISHLGVIQNYLVETFPYLEIKMWFSSVDFNHSGSIY